jgi:hypothetical protein
MDRQELAALLDEALAIASDFGNDEQRNKKSKVVRDSSATSGNLK